MHHQKFKINSNYKIFKYFSLILMKLNIFENFSYKYKLNLLNNNLKFLIILYLCCFCVKYVSCVNDIINISEDTFVSNNDDSDFITVPSLVTKGTIIKNITDSIINDNDSDNNNNNDDNTVKLQLQVHFDNKKFNEPSSLSSLKSTKSTLILPDDVTKPEDEDNNGDDDDDTDDDRAAKLILIANEPQLSIESASLKNANNIENNRKKINTGRNSHINFSIQFNNGTVVVNRRITTPEEYAKSVLFKYYKDGQLTYIADGINEESLKQTSCLPNDKYAFILHGWKESCDVEWVPLLISKLAQYRGGCIICIDYGFFAQEAYVRLVRQYEPLSDLITDKLRYLHEQGFNPDKGYMFGFSYGGQLACAVGRKFGTKLIKEIDTCDMAGPGFDYKVNRLDHRDAAQNVQCIHTTRDKGTKYYTCHQDWRMGNCGYSQPAAKDPPKGSHGLCPYFYINAFEYAFYAIKRPDKCISKKPATVWPDSFKMGYMESRKNEVHGELFAYTGHQYPFNVATTNSNQYLNPEDTYDSINSYDLQYPSRSFIFYNPQQQLQEQIPNFRDRPVLSSIMRARKFLRRLQRNLRNQYSYR